MRYHAAYEVTIDPKPWVVKDETGEVVDRYRVERDAKEKAGGLNLAYSPEGRAFIGRLAEALVS